MSSSGKGVEEGLLAGGSRVVGQLLVAGTGAGVEGWLLTAVTGVVL